MAISQRIAHIGDKWRTHGYVRDECGGTRSG
jgi:hypothetical protein